MRFVGEINANLICAICCDAFDEPITISCGHTFCLGCVQSLAPAACPLDRMPISSSWTQSKIVKLMVDELIVYCLEENCDWEDQRQFLSNHLLECEYHVLECQYGCETKTTNIKAHYLECPNRPMKCEYCAAIIQYRHFPNHSQECQSNRMKCEYCQEHFSELNVHKAECRSRPVSCEHQQFGCCWSGECHNLPSHLAACHYEGVKDYLISTHKTIEDLKEQNRRVIQRLSDMERSVFDIRRTMIASTLSLNTNYAENMHPPFVGPFVNDLAHELSLIKSDLLQLNLKQVEQDTKRNQILMAENQRLRDEVISIRSLLQTTLTRQQSTTIQKKANNTKL